MSKHVATSKGYRRDDKKTDIVSAALIIAFGVITFICGAGMINLIVEVMGVFFIIFALVSYFSNHVIDTALPGIIIGLVLFILGYVGLAAVIVRVIIGIMILLSGLVLAMGTRMVWKGHSFSFSSNQTLNIVLGVVLIVLGIMAMIDLYGCFTILIRVVGIIIAAVGLKKLITLN